MANKLLYTYTRTNNSSIPSPDSKVLTTYQTSLIFDTDRRSIYTHNTEFGYATHINPGTYINANTSINMLSNVGVTSDGTVTYTYSNLVTNDLGNAVPKTDDGLITGISFTGTQMNITYATVRNNSSATGVNAISQYTGKAILDNNLTRFTYVNNVHLDNTGNLTYTYGTIDINTAFAGITNNGGTKSADFIKPNESVVNEVYMTNADGTYTLNVTYTLHKDLTYHILNSTVSSGNVTSVNSVQLWSTYLGDDGTSVSNSNERTHTFKSTTYILPTKKYVDDLIQANDALRYCGTYTAASSTTTTGAFTHNSSAGPAHGTTPDTTVGAVYKVTGTGFFFNTKVTPGDMIISASDSATTSSETGWDVIQANINLQNTGSSALNADSGTRVITNVKLNDSGELTYNYGSLTASTTGSLKNDTGVSGNLVNTSSTKTKIVTGVALTQTNLGTTLTYAYSEIYANQNHHENSGTYGFWQYDPTTNGVDNTKFTQLKNNTGVHFITNVHLSDAGALTYTAEYFTVKYSNSSSNNNTSATTYVSKVYLKDDGTLTYTYADINHVNNHEYTTLGDNTKDILYHTTSSSGTAVKNHVESISAANPQFISNIYLSKDGILSYTAGFIGQADKDNSYGLPSFGNDGVETNSTTRTSASLSGDDIGANHAIINLANNTYIPVVTNTNLDASGKLTYTYTYIHTAFDNNGGSTTATQQTGSIILNNSQKEFTYVNNVHIGDDGKLTYTYGIVKLNTTFTELKNNPEVISGNNNFITDVEITYSDGTYTLTNTYGEFSTGHTTSTALTSYVADVNIDSGGKVTYVYGTIHHDTEQGAQHNDLTSGTANSATVGASYISGIKISNAGVISYTYSNIHHVNESNSSTIQYAGETINKVAQQNYVIVNNIGLDDSGKLTYTLVKVSDNTSDAPDFKSDGKLQTEYTQPKVTDTYTVLRNDKAIPISTYTYLSDTGKLSYTYTHIVGNWGLNTPVKHTTTSTRVGTYVTSINVDAEGRITYAYEDINHVTEQISTLAPATTIYYASQDKDSYPYDGNYHTIGLPTNSDYTIVNNIHLSPEGKLTYTLLTLTSPTNTSTFTEQKPGSTGIQMTINQTQGNNPKQVLNDIRMDANGSITYTYADSIGARYWTGTTYKGEIFNDYSNNIAQGDYSHAEGEGTKALTVTDPDNPSGVVGYRAHAEGYQTTASNNQAHAEGWSTTASGNASHAEGKGTTASANSAHAEGDTTTASGLYSHAEGDGTQATNSGTHSEGLETQATGMYSHAEGSHSVASSTNSHAEGVSTQASGAASHAESNTTTASGESSHAEGSNTTASGTASHAEGYKSTASSSASHAEGSETEATGIDTHAEGSKTHATNNNAHAEGAETTASGVNAHAEGYSTTASGEDSHTSGNQTTAANFAEFSVGYKNVSTHNVAGYGWGPYNESTLFTVGINGSNALDIRQTGVTYLNGTSTYINGTLYHSFTESSTKDTAVDLNTYNNATTGEYTYIITGVALENSTLTYTYEPLRHGRVGTVTSTAGNLGTFNVDAATSQNYLMIPADGTSAAFPIPGNIKYDKNGHINTYTNIYLRHNGAGSTSNITYADPNGTHGTTYAFWRLDTDTNGHVTAAAGTDNIHRVDGHHMLVTDDLTTITNCTTDTIWFYVGN